MSAIFNVNTAELSITNNDKSEHIHFSQIITIKVNGDNAVWADFCENGQYFDKVLKFTASWIVGMGQLPCWPNVVSIYYTYSYDVSLALWPKVEVVYLFDCSFIGLLPEWSLVKSLDLVVHNDITYFPCWTTLESIRLLHYTIQLPLWPMIKHVNIMNYNSDSMLPNWPKITSLIISNAQTLTILPSWLTLNFLDIRLAPLLEKYPAYPNLFDAKIKNHTVLSCMPDGTMWPSLMSLSIINCPLINRIPNWPNIRDIWCSDILLMNGYINIWPMIEKLEERPSFGRSQCKFPVYKFIVRAYSTQVMKNVISHWKNRVQKIG